MPLVHGESGRYREVDIVVDKCQNMNQDLEDIDALFLERLDNCEFSMASTYFTFKWG